MPAVRKTRTCAAVGLQDGPVAIWPSNSYTPRTMFFLTTTTVGRPAICKNSRPIFAGSTRYCVLHRCDLGHRRGRGERAAHSQQHTNHFLGWTPARTPLLQKLLTQQLLGVPAWLCPPAPHRRNPQVARRLGICAFGGRCARLGSRFVAGVCVHKRGADTQHRGSSADAKNTHIVADYLHIWPQMACAQSSHPAGPTEVTGWRLARSAAHALVLGLVTNKS